MVTKVWLKHQWCRLKYFLKHGKDEYGKEGFMYLMYRGIPITKDNSVTLGKIRYSHIDGSFREIDLESGKETILMNK